MTTLRPKIKKTRIEKFLIFGFQGQVLMNTTKQWERDAEYDRLRSRGEQVELRTIVEYV